MESKSLFQKVQEKLASQPDEALLMQKYDAEIGDLALNCVKNANAKDTLMALLKNPVAQTAASGLGGAALGGLIGSQTSSRGEFETDEDYEKRKRNSMITGALAGTAMGAATPSIIAGIGRIDDSLSHGNTWRQTLSKLLINPITVTGAAGGIGGHVLVKRNADKVVELMKNLKKAPAGGILEKEILDQVEKIHPERAISNNQYLKKILGQTLIKRKYMIPAAGVLAALGIGNVLTGDQFYNKPAF